MAEYFPLYQQYAPEGLPPDTLRILAEIESNHNATAQNPWSSAGGLFQFTDSTANAYGLSGNSRFDPEKATEAAARLATDNANYLRQNLGREPTIGELYLAHQQGMGGATALLSKPNANVVDALTPLYGSREQAERVVRQNGGKPNQTAGQFANIWTNKVEKVQRQIPPREIPNVVASQTDTRRPQNIQGNDERPTSAISTAFPTRNATPRLSQELDGIYAYTPPDAQSAHIIGGAGSLTPDFFNRNVPLPQPRPSRAVAGYPTPLPNFAPGPERRLPEIAPPNGASPRMVSTSIDRANAARDPELQAALERRVAAPSVIDQSMQRVASATNPALQRALEDRNANIGKPPTTRVVQSVPVPSNIPRAPANPLSRDSVLQSQRGQYAALAWPNIQVASMPAPMPATATPNTIPGPAPVIKTADALPSMPRVVPQVATALDVVPPAVPRSTIAPGMPPAPIPRPLRTGVNVTMPTAMGQRPNLPMPRAVLGFPTALAQRPSQTRAPAPTLRVTVNGAGSYQPNGSSGGFSAPQTIRGSSTGREYNVGQEYQAGGYRFEARPDGTFKNLGRV